MSPQLVWRSWLYRTAQAHERLLRLATRAGLCGLCATMLLHLLLPGLDHWGLLLLGGSLVPVGVGHALLGESGAFAAAAGESSSASRALTGLLTSAGGVLIVLVGLG